MASPSPRSKSPNQARYSHLLYLSEEERLQYAATLAKSSSSSIPSSRSVRSSASSVKSLSSVSTHNTSRMSTQMPRYADDHYPLITTISPSSIPSGVPKDHAAIWCARQMAQIHNTIIRALNSSWNHSVTIKPNTEEAAHFLQFNQILFKTLDHHHQVEDNYMFPEIEKLLDRPGAMEENVKGHESFAEGLAIFEKYVTVTKPAEFNGVTFRHIIERFAPSLIQHLHDEIASLLALHVVDSAKLMKIWKATEILATKDSDLYTDGPWILGCQDKEFSIDGEPCRFPDMPWIVEVLIRAWHGRRFAGVWRYCPSDLYGKRRLLPAA